MTEQKTLYERLSERVTSIGKTALKEDPEDDDQTQEAVKNAQTLLRKLFERNELNKFGRLKIFSDRGLVSFEWTVATITITRKILHFSHIYDFQFTMNVNEMDQFLERVASSVSVVDTTSSPRTTDDTSDKWRMSATVYTGTLDWNFESFESKDFEREEARKIAETIRDTGTFQRDTYRGSVYFDTWIKGHGQFPFEETTFEKNDRGTYIFEWFSQTTGRTVWVMLVSVEPQ